MSRLQSMFLLAHTQLLLFLALPQISLSGILDPFSWARSDTIDVNIPWLPFENETRCYDELGCLNITRSWYHLINRPFNVFPLPRSVINTRFILYTRDNPTEGQVIKVQDEETIEKSNFNPKKATKFIIHGFIDTPLSNWVGDMRDELMKAGDMNVIVVDWAGGSLPLYTQATANTRLVGLELAYFINYLIKRYDLDPKKVHLVGHSLGAHTAGYAGALVPGLGRITGLDPAEPYFQGMPNHVRLDTTDADLVDVIHTDGKSIFLLGMFDWGYGMSQPCGHLDFYPNNGKEQPGCDITQTPLVPLTLIRDGLEEASRVLVACNHVRAIKLFIDSINSQCPYIAHQCPSYQHYTSGKCFSCRAGSSTGGCALMGYHADVSPALGAENEISQSHHIHGQLTSGSGKYFTITGKEFPYCHRNYRISIQLARPHAAESWVQGHVRVSLHGDAGVIHNLQLTAKDDTRLEHGTTHTVVVAHPADLGGRIRKVELNWEYDMNVLEPRSLCLFWCNDHLYVKSITVEELELPGRGKISKLARNTNKDQLRNEKASMVKALLLLFPQADKKRDAEFSNKLCSPGKRSYAEIPNHGKAVFYDVCRPEIVT